MNAREKRILIITLVIIVGALAFAFLGGDPSGEKSEDTPVITGDVKAEQRNFKSNLAVLKSGNSIRADYASIDLGVAENTRARRPEQELSNQLFTLLTERLNVPNPRMGTGQFSEIPDVDDYAYVDITVEIQGAYQEVMNLMQEMDRLGLLIKDFKVAQRNRGDARQVDLSITVSRLVKRNERINAILKSQRNRG